MLSIGLVSWLRVIALIVAVAGVSWPAAAGNTGDKQDNELHEFTDQTWRLNPDASFLNFQTVKKNAIFETHHFENFSGIIDKSGKASVKIDLASVQTGVDIRDVRVRYLLFETYKFPLAEIVADIDPNSIRDLLSRKRLIYPLTFQVDLHGLQKEFKADVIITRAYNNAVSVATVSPIVVKGADFGLLEGISKLANAVGNIPIANAASVSFNLVFEGERFNPELEQVAKRSQDSVVEKRKSDIAVSACKDRLEVISKTGAIYFRTASARLDAKSEPLLNNLTDVLKRCAGLVVQVAGHTDSDGTAKSNQKLSEARAKSVVAFLVEKGISAERTKAVGFGASKPVAPNDSPTNKAKNRRIEFSSVDP